MKTLYSLLIILTLASSAVHAQTWGIPRLDERLYQLNDTGVVSLEVMAGRIEAAAGNNFTGNIRLGWADVRFDEAARQLRSMLINRGFEAESILLAPQSGGFQNQAVSGLEIRVSRIILRLPECNYALKNYRFDIQEEQGCVLNNALSLSIINPYKIYL